MADPAFQTNAFQNNAFQSWSAILYVDLYDVAKTRDLSMFVLNPFLVSSYDTVISIDEPVLYYSYILLTTLDTVTTREGKVVSIFGILNFFTFDSVKVREKLVSGNLTIGMIGPYDIIITIEGKILKHISGIVYMEI